MRKIQIILLVLIVVGLGLIATQKFWVDRLVGFILEKENGATVSNAPEQNGQWGSMTGGYVDDPKTAKMIQVATPKVGEKIKSPYTVFGMARGPWYFEATFPVVLVDWNGKIIAESHAQAQGEWMTEQFVPFKGEIKFNSPYKAGDPEFMRRGAIILKKDNPSGLPENDAAVEIPIWFE